MYKVKLGKVVLTLAFFVTVLVITLNVFALTSEETVTNWSIKITDDTKDLTEEIQEIKFKVNENSNVVSGKFAPGCVASSKFDLDLVGSNSPVEFTLSVNKSRLSKNINIYAKIDGKDYNLGDEIIISPINNEFSEIDGIKPIELTLVWEDGIEDMSVIDEVLNIPITFTVAEHI